MPADLRALLNAATPGDWHEHEDVPRSIVADSEPNVNLLNLFTPPDDISYAVVASKADHALICALRNAAPTLLDIAEAAQALVDDTLANAGTCPSCGEEDGEHTPDCRFAPLVAALKRLETE